MSDTDIDIIVRGKDEASKALRGASDQVAGLDAAGIKASGTGGGLGSMVTMLGGPATIAAGLAGTAILGVGTAAFSMAGDMSAAMSTVQGQLGLTADEAATLKPAIEDLFTSGLVESANAGAEAIVQARLQLKGMADEDLGHAADVALRLSNTFGEDYGGTLNAINTLQQQFGITFDEASNFVSAGFQKGLNASGDFLDSVGEYSTQFANGGADAGQFFSLLETGMQGGVLGTDKAADAFKEFNIRIVDGSKTTATGLTQLGIDSQEMSDRLADGSITAADAFGQVIAALNKIEDPIARSAAGVALLGTQYEDMGASGILGMDLAKTSLESLNGSTDKVTNTTTDLNTQWKQNMAEMQLALLPLGDALMEIAIEVMPPVREAITWFAGYLKDNLPGAIQTVKENFADFRRGIDQVAAGVVVVQEDFATMKASITGVFDDAARGAGFLGNKLQEMRDWLSGLDDAMPDWLRPGSPTPLEIGLRGVAGEMADLTRSELPAFRTGLQIDTPLLPDLSADVGAAAGSGGGPGGGLMINMPIAGNVVSERDLYAAMIDALRTASRQNGGLEAMGITL